MIQTESSIKLEVNMSNWKRVFGDTLLSKGYSYNVAQDVLKLEMVARKHFEFGNHIPEYFVLENIERENNDCYYYWSSSSETAECPECHTVSHYLRKDYKRRVVQDISEGDYGVYHVVRMNRYECKNLKCGEKIFVERFPDFVDENGRKTHRFKNRCVELSIELGGIGTERVMRGEGSWVSDDTILRYTKEAAAKVTKMNLERDDVKVISIDDINLRKGDSSSACTVFIDEEKHKTLIIIRGTKAENVKKVLELFPSAEHMSRDRSTSLSAAGDTCNKIQSADRFHLICNVHAVIKEALMAELPVDVYIKEGDGWVDVEGEQIDEQYLSIPDEQIDLRIQLAGLTDFQAIRYRNTLKMLELSEKGLRSQEIAERLGLTLKDVRNLRGRATTTVNEVQQKIISRIEKYPKNSNGAGRPPADGVRVTLGPNPGPANKSICEPYRDTVVEMWNTGSSHRTIHKTLTEHGFTGCRAAVYQYIWKLEYEEPCALTRIMKRHERKDMSLTDTFDILTALYLPKVELDKISRTTIYNEILKEGRSERPEDILSNRKKNSTACSKTNRPAMAKHSPLDPEILDLIYGEEEVIHPPSTEDIMEAQKKTS